MQKHAFEQTSEHNYKVVFEQSLWGKGQQIRADGYVSSLPTGDISYLHYHNCLEVGICYEGDGLFLCDGRAESVSKGDIILIFPKTNHYSRGIDRSRLCFCRFAYFDYISLLSPWTVSANDDSRPDVFATRGGMVRGIPPVLREKEYPDAVTLLRKMIQACFNEVPRRDELCGLYMSEFFLRAPCWFERFCFEHEEDNDRTRSVDAPIAKVAAYISLHYAERISAAELAALAHLSESQLRRRFQRKYRRSPMEYLNRLRCKIGAEMLRHTDLTVAVISEKVGYENPSDFYRHFVALMDLSPSEFRKQNT